MAEHKTIRITQVRSEIGGTRRQRESLRGLGLRGIGRSSTVKDTPATRGLIDKVAHLVQVGE
jgi:large subunit ribosomal protein L30